METLLITLNLLALAAFGIVGLLLKRALPIYLEEKAKNLATREDIALITKNIEGVKADYQARLQELQHEKKLAEEGYKDALARRSDYTKAANAAMVDLTKKLAAASNAISWLAWKATVPDSVLAQNDFATYDQTMIPILGDLIGLQAALAAIDAAKFGLLSPLAEELYERDVTLGKAQLQVLSSQAAEVAAGRTALADIYRAALDFDRRLLYTVTGLLQVTPAAH